MEKIQILKIWNQPSGITNTLKNPNSENPYSALGIQNTYKNSILKKLKIFLRLLQINQIYIQELYKFNFFCNSNSALGIENT